MWRHSLSHMEKAVMVSLPSGMLSQGFLVHILETFLQICLPLDVEEMLSQNLPRPRVKECSLQQSWKKA